MKRDARAEVRGQYRPIASALPGVPICEKLPRMARVMDKVTLIRTVRHEMRNHNSAGYYSRTGVAPPTDDQRLRDSRELFQANGSVVDRFATSAAGTPTFVSYPYVISDGSITPGEQASFVGPQYDPFFITQDPNDDDFRLPELSLPANLSAERLGDRRGVLDLIDRGTQMLEFSARARGIDAYYHRALTMLTSPTFRRAFDLSAEPARLRDRDGRTTYGQGCLLARRLVEAGARVPAGYYGATIRRHGFTSGGWATHSLHSTPMQTIPDPYLFPHSDPTLPT